MVDRKITGLEVAGSSPVTITFYTSPHHTSKHILNKRSMGPLAECQTHSYQYPQEPFNVKIHLWKLLNSCFFFIQKHKNSRWLFCPNCIVFPVGKALLQVVWVNIQKSWKAASQEIVAGLFWALVEDCLSDVQEQHHFDAELFWPVAGESTLVASIGDVSRQQMQLVVYVGGRIMASEKGECSFGTQLFFSEDASPCLIDTLDVFLPCDELIEVIPRKGNITKKLHQSFF